MFNNDILILILERLSNQDWLNCRLSSKRINNLITEKDVEDRKRNYQLNLISQEIERIMIKLDAIEGLIKMN